MHVYSYLKEIYDKIEINSKRYHTVFDDTYQMASRRAKNDIWARGVRLSRISCDEIVNREGLHEWLDLVHPVRVNHNVIHRLRNTVRI
jgi:hypothetical protein